MASAPLNLIENVSDDDSELIGLHSSYFQSTVDSPNNQEIDSYQTTPSTSKKECKELHHDVWQVFRIAKSAEAKKERFRHQLYYCFQYDFQTADADKKRKDTVGALIDWQMKRQRGINIDEELCSQQLKQLLSHSTPSSIASDATNVQVFLFAEDEDAAEESIFQMETLSASERFGEYLQHHITSQFRKLDAISKAHSFVMLLYASEQRLAKWILFTKHSIPRDNDTHWHSWLDLEILIDLRTKASTWMELHREQLRGDVLTRDEWEDLTEIRDLLAPFKGLHLLRLQLQMKLPKTNVDVKRLLC
ncbi:MAG: hypothetical protein Q9157_008393, partial [Trypethelium eluteriae]